MTDYTTGAGASGTGGVATDETTAVIASNKVEGTAVYSCRRSPRQGLQLHGQ